MKPVSDVILGVVDSGLFLPIAQKLGEQCKHVYYWTPNDRCMVKLDDNIIGDGFENIERVQDIWSIKNQCDGFCFPDIGMGGLQKELIDQGFPVWGHRGGDVLESNRGLFLDTLKELRMDVPEYKVAKGLSELRSILKDEEDKYIKVSKFRGDFETLHWRSFREDETALDELAYKLGPAKELLTFYILDPIETDIEDGTDSYCINGQFPNKVMHGIEQKDKSYLCSIQDSSDIDERVRIVNELFAPVLKSFDYRGFFSTEVRISGDKGFFIDPTCRAGSPPSQVMTELFSNLGEIVWAGANGELVEPKPSSQFGVQALMTVDREECEWMVMDIPNEIRQWTKFGFGCEIDGRICEPPHCMGHTAGWLVAIGDTIQESIESLKDHASQLPDGVGCDIDSLAKLLKEAESAKDEGIEFSNQPIPEPAIILESI